MRRAIILTLLIVVATGLQITATIFFQEGNYIRASIIQFLQLLFLFLLYRVVPLPKKFAHGLLELLYKQIISNLNTSEKKIAEEKLGLRCSLLFPIFPKSWPRKKLKVHYRYPRSHSNTSFSIDKIGTGQGLAGKVSKLNKPQQETDIPLLGNEGYQEFWGKYNINPKEAADFADSKMKSIYCWPITSEKDKGNAIAVLSIDSKVADALEFNPEIKKDIIEKTYIPMISKALETGAESGVASDIIKIIK